MDDIIIIMHLQLVSWEGIGKELLDDIVRYAIKNNKKAIGIDVIYGNVGAGKVSGKLGFEYVDSVRIFHNAGGLERFHL